MRKFAIDPEKDTGQPTLCNTLRRLWRRVDDPEAREMIADCFDYAKRMDARMREAKYQIGILEKKAGMKAPALSTKGP